MAGGLKMPTKVQLKKQQKTDSLLTTAYKLFTEKGIANTSIADISEKAGVAKGTFYLYFKDKYDLRDRLIAKKAHQLVMAAYHKLKDPMNAPLEDSVIALTDDILDTLNNDRPLMNFLSKNLSSGVFNRIVKAPSITCDEEDFRQIFMEMLAHSQIHYRDPDIMLFLIIEMTSATGHSAIMYRDPVDLAGLKPHLHTAIRDIMNEYREKGTES